MKPVPALERVKLNITLDNNVFRYRQTPPVEAIILHQDQTLDMEMENPFTITFRKDRGHRKQYDSPFEPGDLLEIKSEEAAGKWGITRAVRHDAEFGHYHFKVTALGSGPATSSAPKIFEDDPEIIIEQL